MERFILPDNVIFKISEDRKGRIWFFSYSGNLSYYYQNQIHLYPYNNEISAKIIGTIINEAYIDATDHIHLTNKAGFGAVIDSAGNYSALTDTSSDRPEKKTVFQIRQINDHFSFASPVINTAPRLNIFSIQLKTAEQTVDYDLSINYQPGTAFGCKTIDKDNYVFFSGSQLIKLTSSGKYQVINFDTHINHIEIIHDEIFVGKDDGLDVYDFSLQFKYNIKNLQGFLVSGIKKDYEGGIWFSTTQKGIFYIKSLSVGLKDFDSLSSMAHFKLCPIDDSTIISGSSAGLLKISDHHSTFLLKHNFANVTDLFFSGNRFFFSMGWRFNGNKEMLNYHSFSPDIKKDLYYFCSNTDIIQQGDNYYYSDGFGIYKTSVSNPKNTIGLLYYLQVKSIFLDNKDQIWLGNLKGLYLFDTLNNRVVPFKADHPLFKKGVGAIRQLDNGIYTIGIRFGGIALMKDTTVIANITTSDGLLSNSISYLLPQGNRLWVATSEGISVIDFTNFSPLKYHIVNIGKNRGLYNFVIHELLPFQHKILAATSQGIYFIEQPESILSTPASPLDFYITSVSYGNSDTSFGDHLIIPYDLNRIKVNYNAICYNSPDDVKYYYKFSKDTLWQSSSSNELLLENLPPGEYVLELKAEIPLQNRISAVHSIHIVVKTPWFYSKLFWSLFILVFILLAYAGFSYRLKKVKQKNEEQMNLTRKMADLQQSALRSQMNPHFIFNCLTSIQHLILSKDIDTANKYLVKFSKLIRKTLEISGYSYISVAEERDYINEYVSLEQLRLPNHFDFKFEIDPRIEIYLIEIPSMLLQPIVENSIRHGIKSLQDRKGKITIRMMLVNDYIHCSIKDNGVGRSVSSVHNTSIFTDHKSFGINNVISRLDILNESEQSNIEAKIIDLTNDDGSVAGTEVIIHLPYKIRTS